MQVAVCSKLFDSCCTVILDSQGTVDKFIGDCIMAFWGAPNRINRHQEVAVVAMQKIIQNLQAEPEELPDCMPDVGFRIGAHSGECLVGNFGATDRWNYTAVGDVVNTAARLETLNKQMSTRCLMSAAVYDEVREVPELSEYMRPLGNVLLVGKTQEVSSHLHRLSLVS